MFVLVIEDNSTRKWLIVDVVSHGVKCARAAGIRLRSAVEVDVDWCVARVRSRVGEGVNTTAAGGAADIGCLKMASTQCSSSSDGIRILSGKILCQHLFTSDK